MVRSHGRRLLTAGPFEVAEVGGAVFYHAPDPLTVGGPFPSLESLVRSEGRRRYPESRAEEIDYEVFEWAATFFRVERNGDHRTRTYASLEEARRG
jgi:hypothetical protein